MGGGSQVYVLDCFALFAYFQAELGGERVKKLVLDALSKVVSLHLSIINLGELYYMTYKKLGEKAAESIVADTESLPIHIQSVTDAQVRDAAKLKATFSISYADAFAASLAKALNAVVVTGDPEFKDISNRIKVLWILDEEAS